MFMDFSYSYSIWLLFLRQNMHKSSQITKFSKAAFLHILHNIIHIKKKSISIMQFLEWLGLV